jgi:O-antigen/teichoic acid export membrane protein
MDEERYEPGLTPSFDRSPGDPPEATVEREAPSPQEESQADMPCASADAPALAQREQAQVSRSARPSRERMVSNAMMNLIDFLAFTIQGFVIAPLMLASFSGRFSRTQAQDLMGVWDLGWSTVACLKLLYLGVASSVNRYVARHRATDDWAALNRSATACGCMLAFSGIAGAVGAVFLALWWMPNHIHAGDGRFAYLQTAQWVVLFLGLCCAIEMFMSTYNGVITGFQRYDLVTWIDVSMLTLQLIGMVVVLRWGYGLKALAVVIFGIKLLESVLVWIVAHRTCPTLRLKPSLVSRHDLWEVTHFGLKTFLNTIPDAAVESVNAWLVSGRVGLAPLAWLKRSTNLVNNSRKGVFQITRILAPVSSEAQALGEQKTVRLLAENSTKYSLLLSLPGMLALALLSKPLLRLWLGPRAPEFYSLPLLPILAIGNLVQMAVMGPRSVLLGLNKHGWTGILNMISGSVTVAAIILSLTFFHGGIVSVAICLAAAPTLVTLVGMPIVVKRGTGLSIRRMARLLVEAIVLVVPFACWLLACRYGAYGIDYASAYLGLGPTHLAQAWQRHERLGDAIVVLLALGGGGLLLLACYWRTAIPEALKNSLRRVWGKVARS